MSTPAFLDPLTKPTVEIDEEGLLINGTRFHSCPTLHQLVEAVGSPPIKPFADSEGSLGSVWWPEFGLLAWIRTESTPVYKLSVFLTTASEIPEEKSGWAPYRIATKLSIQPFQGTLTVWGLTCTAKTPHQRLFEVKPGSSPSNKTVGRLESFYSSEEIERKPELKSINDGRPLWHDPNVFVSTADHSFDGGHAQGQGIPHIKYAHGDEGFLVFVEISLPPRNIPGFDRGIFQLLPDERVLGVLVRHFHRNSGLISTGIRQTRGSANTFSPELCVTNIRLIARLEGGTLEQWSLNDLRGIELISEVTVSNLAHYGLGQSMWQKLWFSFIHHGSGDAKGVHNTVMKIVGTSSQPRIFLYMVLNWSSGSEYRPSTQTYGEESFGALANIRERVAYAVGKYSGRAPELPTLRPAAREVRASDEVDVRNRLISSLIECADCHIPMSPSAEACPKCGSTTTPHRLAKEAPRDIPQHPLCFLPWGLQFAAAVWAVWRLPSRFGVASDHDIAGALVLGCVAVAVFAVWKMLILKHQIVKLTPTKLIYRQGVFGRDIQWLDRSALSGRLRQSLLGRLLGYGTVVVKAQTAELHLYGLDLSSGNIDELLK